MHVCFHEFLNEVNLGEGLVAGGLDDIEDGNNVLVIEPSEQLDFSQCPQAVDNIYQVSLASVERHLSLNLCMYQNIE